jgi:hypothetical protein
MPKLGSRFANRILTPWEQRNSRFVSGVLPVLKGLDKLNSSKANGDYKLKQAATWMAGRSVWLPPTARTRALTDCRNRMPRIGGLLRRPSLKRILAHV